MSFDSRQFYDRILRTISHYQMIDAGDLILVGVSGGIDSVVLLHVFVHLRERLKIQLHVAHLNHQFRGEEAARDADFVRQLASQLQIPCTIESHNVPERIRQNKLSPQDAARQVRYEFFETLAHRLNARKIATAHNADDQAETLLLGLIRGVGLQGLGGIRPMLQGKIIRPLLTTSRDQIEAFARAKGVQCVFDSSNASRKYLRNAIRLDLLPLLKRQFNPAIVKRLTAYTQLFQEDAFFIDKIAQEHYIQLCEQVEQGIRIQAERFARHDVTIQRAIIYKAYQEITGGRHKLETEHARAVIRLFTQKPCEKRICLPGQVLAVRTGEWGYLQHEVFRVPSCGVSPKYLVIPGQTIFGNVVIESEVIQTQTPELYACQERRAPDVIVQHLDYDCVAAPVSVRFRRPGDAFCPLGMNGSKSVKKFFIDRKVLRNKRDNIPLLIDNHGIIWIIGYSIADRVKVTAQTRQIVTFRVFQYRA